MFQFTTTNVINSDKDLTTGKPLWSLQEKDSNTNLHIKRINNFKKHNVLAIYQAKGYNAEMAKVKVRFSDIPGNRGDIFRIYIQLGLSQGSADSRYTNDLAYRSKPISIEFMVLDSAAETVKQLVKNINKYELMVYGNKLLKVSTTAGDIIAFEATDEYQRFQAFSIDYFNKEANHGMGEYEPRLTLKDLKEYKSNQEAGKHVSAYFRGKEGFGTYSWLLHNLRIPTDMRTRAFGMNQDETPIVGALYDQYTIYYCANRGILGDNAVGDLTKSLTTHVFYVKQDLSEAFKTALATLGTVNEAKGVEPVSLVENLEVITKALEDLKKDVATRAKTEEIAKVYETKEDAKQFAKTSEVASTYQTKADSQSLAGEYTKTSVLETTYLKQTDISEHIEELKSALNRNGG